MQRIFVYISSLFLCMLTVNIEAQKAKKPVISDQTPLFNSLTIQTDIAPVLSSVVSGGETFGYEAGAQLDLKHKFFPIIEIGNAVANTTTTNDIKLKSNGFYGRLGVDINVISQKKDEKPSNNQFLAGVRLGMSDFPFSLSNVQYSDDYWGENQTVNLTKNAKKVWYEIVVGVRVELTKNIFMGWTVRNRTLLSTDESGDLKPWYIPGYGINSENNWGIGYVIGYKFQFPNKTKTVKEKIKPKN